MNVCAFMFLCMYTVYVCAYTCMYVYVMYVHIMCSSDLLKTCELACNSKVSHNDSSIFCIIYFTQSERIRDNLQRL